MFLFCLHRSMDMDTSNIFYCLTDLQYNIINVDYRMKICEKNALTQLYCNELLLLISSMEFLIDVPIYGRHKFIRRPHISYTWITAFGLFIDSSWKFAEFIKWYLDEVRVWLQKPILFFFLRCSWLLIPLLKWKKAIIKIFKKNMKLHSE